MIPCRYKYVFKEPHMRIVCNKSELQKNVNIAAKAVALKSPVYLLEGIRIEAKDNQITLYGSDGTLSIKCTIEANVVEEGDVVLPAKLFCELLAKFEECDISLYKDGSNIVLECGHSKTTLCYMSAEQYPAFPKFDVVDGITLYSKQFVSMIDQTVFATSASEEKPILTGLLMELSSNGFKMVALDGYRLAVRKESLMSQHEDKEVVVPSKSMREVARIIPEDETTIKVFTKENLVGIVCENIEIVSRVLQGDYVKYKNILPSDFMTRVIVSRQSLLGSLERASIMARQSKTNLVNFDIDGSNLTITSDSEVGKAREEVDIRLTGKNLSISFNARYLLDVLKEVADEEIVMDFNTNISPCVIHPISGDSYLYLVLPVKTSNS